MDDTNLLDSECTFCGVPVCRSWLVCEAGHMHYICAPCLLEHFWVNPPAPVLSN